MAGGARQLHLFKGKRQRGIAPPPPKEFATHVALADTLRRWAMPDWLWTHFPAGEDRGHRYTIKGKRVSPTASRLQRMGLRPGFPDFLFFHARGACAFLELKRSRAVPSEEQKPVFAFLAHAGHPFLITTSFDDAVGWLKDIGVLRSGVHVQ